MRNAHEGSTACEVAIVATERHPAEHYCGLRPHTPGLQASVLVLRPQMCCRDGGGTWRRRVIRLSPRLEPALPLRCLAGNQQPSLRCARPRRRERHGGSTRRPTPGSHQAAAGRRVITLNTRARGVRKIS